MFSSVRAISTALFTVEPIPFRQPVAASDWGGATSLTIAALLLVVAFALLFAIKRAGWLSVRRDVSEGIDSDSLQVKRRLRLSPTCHAYVLSYGSHEVLIVESKFNARIKQLTGKPTGRTDVYAPGSIHLGSHAQEVQVGS